MKIIINGRFLIHRVTGVERYAREIILELDRICKRGEFILAVPPEVDNYPSYQNIEIVKVGKLQNHLWEQISFPYYVFKQHGISLNLCNVAPMINPGVVTIHDLKIKVHPEYFSKKFLLWYNFLFKVEIKYARMIITGSEFSKMEIIKYYDIDPNRISVISDAWQHINRIEYDENALSKYGLVKGTYFFSMSSMDPNKNFKWISEKARQNPNNIFAVAGTINKTVFKNGLDFEKSPNMKLLGYITDGEGKTLMRDCKAFLFPSFYEGFGMPPLEAIGSGCQCVIVSDIPIMHEIFGDGAEYIDVKSMDLEVKAMQDKSKVLSKYSWNVSAKKLYELIQKL